MVPSRPRSTRVSELPSLLLTLVATGAVRWAVDKIQSPSVEQSFGNSAALARELDIWEVNHEARYVVALVRPARYAQLASAGYRLEIDPLEFRLRNCLRPGDETPHGAAFRHDRGVM